MSLVTIDGSRGEGGGKIIAHVEPAANLAGFDLLQRGQPRTRSAKALLSKLPDHIGERQIRTVDRLLRWPSDSADSEVVHVHSPGPGTICVVDLEFERVTEVVSAVGRRGLSSERVGTHLVRNEDSAPRSRAWLVCPSVLAPSRRRRPRPG